LNIASLIMGFILGAVATVVFMSTLKSSGNNTGSEGAANNKLKFNPMLGVFVLVPILAGLVYWKTGSPDAASVSVPATAMPAKDMSGTDLGAIPEKGHEMGDLGAMAQKLADKLAQDPNNGDGWALLAHSYVELKEHKNAVGAFSKAVELIPDDPQLIADYADALAVTNNGKFDAKSTELVQKALKIDPNHPKALLLAGTIAFSESDYAKAIADWEHLAALVSKDDPMLSKQLEANIAEARTLLAKQ
jgi:cytochrome c-type biogenesis protein CcmH